MLQLVPWMEGPHALHVQASLSRWEPADRRAERLRGVNEYSEDSDPDSDDGVAAARATPRGRNPLLPAE